MELSDARDADVGGQHVRRALPLRGRRTVGAWCFADHFGPTTVVDADGPDVAPHPHLGLHTVTWLVSGEMVHRDSLGTEQVIRPGQLNLMTAGSGIAHSEEMTGRFRGDLHGIQLWVAQPERTRHGPAAFEHHDDLPRVELAAAEVTVLVGSLGGAVSPARHDTELLGAQLAVRPGTTAVPLDPGFEHALVVLQGRVEVAGAGVGVGRLAYLGPGSDEVALTAHDGATVVLLGGVPFPEPVLMFWNFVGRTRDELAEAASRWNAGGEGFGVVRSRLARLPSPSPFWRTG